MRESSLRVLRALSHGGRIDQERVLTGAGGLRLSTVPEPVLNSLRILQYLDAENRITQRGRAAATKKDR